MKSLLGKLGVILIGLFIFVHAEVWAADWKFYGAHENFLIYYDTQSITRPSKSIVRVWTRWDYTEKVVLDWVKKFGKNYENLSHSKIFQEINCAEKKFHSLTGNDYDNKGKVISSSHTPSEWGFIIPDSVGESLYEEVCK